MGLAGLPDSAAQQSGVWPSRTQGDEYSRKVPQQVRIWRDADTRSGTVTCGYGRGWTCGLLFASRGSGVRVPLAPPGQKLNSNSRVREYSSKVQQPGPRDILHTRSSWALPSQAAAHRSQVLGPSSGPLSRKNAFGRAQCRLPATSRQRAESAVSRRVLAAHTEGQGMVIYFSHIRLRILVTLHELTARISPTMHACELRHLPAGSWL
jgi:hypothetical protein